MNEVLEQKFVEAATKHRLERCVWKDVKVVDENGNFKQNERKLMDMSNSDLRKCYEHCKTMLYNPDTSNPGRYVVLNIINDQKNRCGAELFLRWFEQTKQSTRFALVSAINSNLDESKVSLKNSSLTIGDITDGLPTEYSDISLELIVDGCLDKLGAFNKKHITRTFILKQGIWLTSQEAKDLEEFDEDNKLRDRLEVVRERLDLKDAEKLSINAKGLSYNQMRAMFQLKKYKKYMEMTTVQLETLRYKVLFNLEDTVKRHIISWEKRMEEIELVAEHLGYKL